MITSITALSAAEHVADLQRVAQARRRTTASGSVLSSSTRASAPVIALRLAHADEDQIVRRLADLDDARPLEGQVMLALIDGEAVAALSLRDGRVVANPFVLTDEAVALMRLRAAGLAGASRRPRLRTVLRARFA